jgi:hypothetical protein
VTTELKATVLRNTYPIKGTYSIQKSGLKEFPGAATKQVFMDLWRRTKSEILK